MRKDNGSNSNPIIVFFKKPKYNQPNKIWITLNCYDYWLCLNQTRTHPIVSDWERVWQERTCWEFEREIEAGLPTQQELHSRYDGIEY